MAPTWLTDRQKRDLLKLLRDVHGPNPLPWDEPLPPTKREKSAITKKVELRLPLDGGERAHVAEGLQRAWLSPIELNAYRRQRRRHHIEIIQHQIRLAAKRGCYRNASGKNVPLPGIAAGTVLDADDVDYLVAKLFGFRTVENLRRSVGRERAEAKKR